jgi:hypothetical protein
MPPPAHIPCSCRRVRQTVRKNIMYIEIFMLIPPILHAPHIIHASYTYTPCPVVKLSRAFMV